MATNESAVNSAYTIYRKQIVDDDHYTYSTVAALRSSLLVVGETDSRSVFKIKRVGNTSDEMGQSLEKEERKTMATVLTRSNSPL